MSRTKKTGIARDMTLCLVFGCLLMTTPVAYWGYYKVVQAAEADLVLKGTMLCQRLGHILETRIWNLDTVAIEEYFRVSQFPTDLVFVQLLTQYGDSIYRSPTANGIAMVTHRQALFREGEEIGAIEVGLSRADIDTYRKQMAKLALTLAVLVTATIGIVSSVLIRLLLGRPLNILGRQLRAVAAGNYSGRLPPHRYREVDTINMEVNHMADQIGASTAALQTEIAERRRVENARKHMSDNLEVMVDRRTSQLTELNEALYLESDKRKRVQREIIEVSNREQRRMGQDLHDSLCQELAGIAFLAGSLERNLAAKEAPDAKMAKQVVSLLRESVFHVQRVAGGLNPVALDAEGLVFALKGIVKETEDIFHVHCNFSCVGNGIIYNDDVAVHLFHIAREAIHNAIRHGKAGEIRIQLVTGDETGRIVIGDNGVGFLPPQPSEPPNTGMGLQGMMYRAELIGGHLSVESRMNAGTTITVSFENNTDGQPPLTSASVPGITGEEPVA